MHVIYSKNHMNMGIYQCKKQKQKQIPLKSYHDHQSVFYEPKVIPTSFTVQEMHDWQAMIMTYRSMTV